MTSEATGKALVGPAGTAGAHPVGLRTFPVSQVFQGNATGNEHFSVGSGSVIYMEVTDSGRSRNPKQHRVFLEMHLFWCPVWKRTSGIPGMNVYFLLAISRNLWKHCRTYPWTIQSSISYEEFLSATFFVFLCLRFSQDVLLSSGNLTSFFFFCQNNPLGESLKEAKIQN